MTILTLHDVPVLEPLAHVADELATDLVLFGSVASRIALRDQFEVPVQSLFDVAEHISDIDVAHLGPPGQTKRVRAAIAEHVPMASWLRWSVIDRTEFWRRTALAHYNWKVPLRSARIGSAPSLTNLSVLSNIRQAAQFAENRLFDSSPRASYDTEAAALFLHLDGLIDLAEVGRLPGSDFASSINIGTVQSAVRAATQRIERLSMAAEIGDELRRNAAIRRLWYRLASVAFRLSPLAFRDLIERAGLSEFLEFLDRAFKGGGFQRLLRGGKPVVISAAQDPWRNDFRLPPAPTIEDDPFRVSDEELNEQLRRSFAKRERSLASTEPVELADGNHVVAAIRNVPVNRGFSRSTPKGRSLPEEFVHISLPMHAWQVNAFPVERLTAVAFGLHDGDVNLLPAYASVSKSIELPIDEPQPCPELSDGFMGSPGRWTIRLNLPGALNEIEALHFYLIARGDIYA